ncbi:MAG: sigma-70 family RNA polymerase sigma factor [Nakamurella sp.]
MVIGVDASWASAAAGDRDAFATFYQWRADTVFTHVRARVHDSVAAQDLTAEVFATAWRCRRKVRFDPDAGILPWLLATANNLLRKHYRAHARLQQELPPISTLVHAQPDLLDELVGDDRFAEALRNLPAYRLPEDVKQRHLKMLAALPAEARPSRSARSAMIVGSVVMLTSAGFGTAAALGVFSARVADRSIAHCYATTDVDGVGNHFDLTVAEKPGAAISERDAATIARDICRGAWQDGSLSAYIPYLRDSLTTESPENNPVPALTACVLQNGQVGIFPGDIATCGQMDLAIAHQ